VMQEVALADPLGPYGYLGHQMVSAKDRSTRRK
jgi:hypothetical protein